MTSNSRSNGREPNYQSSDKDAFSLIEDSDLLRRSEEVFESQTAAQKLKIFNEMEAQIIKQNVTPKKIIPDEYAPLGTGMADANRRRRASGGLDDSGSKSRIIDKSGDRGKSKEKREQSFGRATSKERFAYLKRGTGVTSAGPMHM